MRRSDLGGTQRRAIEVYSSSQPRVHTAKDIRLIRSVCIYLHLHRPGLLQPLGVALVVVVAIVILARD